MKLFHTTLFLVLLTVSAANQREYLRSASSLKDSSDGILSLINNLDAHEEKSEREDDMEVRDILEEMEKNLEVEKEELDIMKLHGVLDEMEENLEEEKEELKGCPSGTSHVATHTTYWGCQWNCGGDCNRQSWNDFKCCD
jgi:hypothetical protein